MIFTLKEELLREYLRFEKAVEENLDQNSYDYENYRKTVEILKDMNSSYIYLTTCLANLTRIVSACFKKNPILLIDEYDQPILSSYEYGYHDELGAFFSTFFGAALKGNQSLAQALLTGIQRVAKESIFSQLNSPKVYTVMSRQYASYFGLTVSETAEILNDYGLELNEDVQRMYNGYQFAGIEIYNPWSILNYVERESNYSLWGLLVNAGYLTVLHRNDATSAVVRIPNDEVMSELLMIVTEISGLEGQGLSRMFTALLSGDIEGKTAIQPSPSTKLLH